MVSIRSIVRKPKYRIVTGSKKGLPPGSLVHTGTKTNKPVSIIVTEYSDKNIDTLHVDDITKLEYKPRKKKQYWLDVRGVHDKDVLSRIGSLFNIHPLVLEDIMNTSQRPKIEEYEGYSYIVLRGISNNHNPMQVSIIMGNGFVLSFQEEDYDIFSVLSNGLQKPDSRLRRRKADYLAYRMIDIIIDEYFVVLEDYGDRLELLEEMISDNPTKKALSDMHSLKREIIMIRRSVWPAREVISRLSKLEGSIISDDTRVYIRDAYDHCVQVIDAIESYRDILSSLHDIYLTTISNRMGEVMKVLTVIATIFIPLTFIAGVYGMNFVNMPELEWQYGYFMILGIMAMIMIGMLYYFRRREWV
ncbi:MAG: magnesium/cobalt transporter CorA [Candidatus Woesearchaeota archaeon]